MSRRRVLFVHHRPQPSGAARSLALLIEGLGDEWEAHVVVPGGGAAELLADAGATIHRAPVPAFTHTWDVQYHGLRWLVALRELLWAPAHVRALRRLLREVQPALVHLNDSVLLVSGIVAHRAHVPVVWHLRSSLAHGGRDRRSRWICRVIDRTGSAAIAIDADVAASFPELRLASTVVPNPVRVEAAERDEGTRILRVGYVGYLRRQKGWPELLEALRLLDDEGIAVHATFVGGAIRPPDSFRGWRGRLLRAVGIADEQSAFEARVRELGVGRLVTQHAFVRDLQSLYGALDVVVFPNQGAGLGRPVLEAAGYGLPAVASGSHDGGGVLQHGVTGILLASGGSREIADALRSLAGDPARRLELGRAAAALAAGWRPEASAEAVSRVYEQTLERR